MGSDERHAEYDISYIANDRIKITTQDCSLVTECFEDKDIKRTTMGPADILFSAFAL